jgi:hypothetical protein
MTWRSLILAYPNCRIPMPIWSHRNWMVMYWMLTWRWKKISSLAEKKCVLPWLKWWLTWNNTMMGSGSPPGCKRGPLERQVWSVLLEGKNAKDLLVFRKTKGSFPWPQHCCKISMDTTMPRTHLGNEESIKTYQVFCPLSHAPLVPIALSLNICSSIVSCIYSHIKGVIHGHVKGVVYGIISCTIDHPIIRTLFAPTFFAWSITCRTEWGWKRVR